MIYGGGTVFEGSTYYALDETGKRKGLREVEEQFLSDLNDLRFGIFFTVNSFEGPRRRVNLKHINAWYIDIDKEDKRELLRRLKNAPLSPSIINETRNGYHAFWLSKDATSENYKEIEKRLIHYFQVKDAGVCDLTRVLRVPGYLHWKQDPPFLVRTVWIRGTRYSEEEMCNAFPKPAVDFAIPRIKRTKGPGGSWIDQLKSVECKQALSQLSGTEHVQYDRYGFEPRSNGTEQIVFNGDLTKTSSNFIGPNGRIGSWTKRGPSIIQWLQSYGHDLAKIKEIGQEFGWITSG